MKDNGVCILLTTHYLEEANELCDRVCIIDAGSMVGLGTPEQLKKETVSDLHRLTVRFKERPNLNDLKLPLPVELQEFEATFKGPPEQLWETVGILERKFGGRIAEIVYTQPTLDDVFIKLTQSRKERN
jgi:ABC-2 type transport system ATP-binding protein